jgi:hypothetical protein
MVRKATWTPAAERRKSPLLTGVFGDLVRAFRCLIDSYRPELHYMRGPGPKWHAKHDPVPGPADAAGIPGQRRRQGPLRAHPFSS